MRLGGRIMRLPSMRCIQMTWCLNQWAGEANHTHREGCVEDHTKRGTSSLHQALQNPMASASAIQTQILASLQHPVSQRLTSAGLQVHHPIRRLPLTPAQKRLHLEWCHNREASLFCITTDDHCVRVWHCRGERTNPANVVDIHTSVTSGIMVWGATGYRVLVLPILLSDWSGIVIITASEGSRG